MFYGWEKVEKNQVLKLLKQLRELFSTPDTWNYWPIAVDLQDNEVSPLDPKAIKWSLMGACDLLTTEYGGPVSGFISCATREYLNDLSDEKLIHGNFSYQDEMALIDLAIEDLEKEILNERSVVTEAV